MYSESAAEDLLGSTKQNDDKKDQPFDKELERLFPSVIAPCSQVGTQGHLKTGKPVVVLCCIRWYKGKGNVLSSSCDLIYSLTQQQTTLGSCFRDKQNGTD